jgi:hypothetical protein
MRPWRGKPFLGLYFRTFEEVIMEILEAKLTKQERVVATVITDGGKKEQKEFSAVRAGLSLATPTAGGYWVVLGQEYRGGTRFEGQVPEAGKIHFLKEHLSPSMFFPHILDSLSDAAARYLFHDVYLDYDQEEERKTEEISFLNDLLYKRQLAVPLGFSTAPYYKDFFFGISIINNFLERGLLVLADTCLAREQLRNLKKGDLEPGEGEAKFEALNALRFVIASFHKFPPDPRGPYTPPRRRSGTSYNVRRPR